MLYWFYYLEVFMWILILFAHAGMMSDHDSMALTHVPGFVTEELCIDAGKKAKAIPSGTVKEIRFTCVKAKFN